MTKEEQVARAAAWLRRKGERVSVRKARRRIQKEGWAGGSFSDIAKALTVWKIQNEYTAPRIETADLPERLQGLLVTFGKEAWDYATTEAMARMRADREQLDNERKVLRDIADEALKAADEAEARADRLGTELAALRSGVWGWRILTDETCRGRISPFDWVAPAERLIRKRSQAVKQLVELCCSHGSPEGMTPGSVTAFDLKAGRPGPHHQARPWVSMRAAARRTA